jgi:hypothetical protein
MRRIKTSIKVIAFQTFAFLLWSTATGAAEPGSIIRTKSPKITQAAYSTLVRQGVPVLRPVFTHVLGYMNPGGSAERGPLNRQDAQLFLRLAASRSPPPFRISVCSPCSSGNSPSCSPISSSTRLKGKSASMVIRQSRTFPTHRRTSGRSVPGTNNEEQ